ncbi:PTS mannose/fructose/sorbose/N-acetylgalactosamine transporter subunit IIC [Leucobacter sp. USHLN154]|uniref:PTS mannose/fructose/sorbose/N-acetylgalactosamine transporter subunit IIC n=1 Tax=Leucobacter sp. USHLN154 TaxID=3081269 RepID=UPI003018C9FE
MTLTQAVLIGLVAALTHLDGAWFGEMKFREPIITGFLVGLILGDVAGGLVIGAALQLMWMGITGVGVTPKLDIGVGGTIGAAAALSTGAGAEKAILFAVPVALLMQFVDTLMTSAFSALMPVAERQIDQLKINSVQAIHYMCGVIALIVYFVPTFAGMYYGNEAIQAIVDALPEWLNNGLIGISVLLPALGFAMLLDIILTPKLVPFLILGFVPAAFVGHDLTMVGIAAIAVAIALVIYSIYTDLRPKPAVQIEPNERELVAANEWED